MYKIFIYFFCIGVFTLSCSSQEDKKTRRLLFIESEKGAIRLKRGLSSYYTITLTNLAPQVFIFYLDPIQDLEQIYVDRLVAYWESDEGGLSWKGPGAAVIVTPSDNQPVPLLFRVQDPKYDMQTNTLIFNAHTSRPIEKEMLEKLSGKITLLIEVDV